MGGAVVVGILNQLPRYYHNRSDQLESHGLMGHRLLVAPLRKAEQPVSALTRVRNRWGADGERAAQAASRSTGSRRY